MIKKWNNKITSDISIDEHSESSHTSQIEFHTESRRYRVSLAQARRSALNTLKRGYRPL